MSQICLQTKKNEIHWQISCVQIMTANEFIKNEKSNTVDLFPHQPVMREAAWCSGIKGAKAMK